MTKKTKTPHTSALTRTARNSEEDTRTYTAGKAPRW